MQVWDSLSFSSFAETHNQEFQYDSVLFMYILSCDVYVHAYIKYILVCTCIYILHGVLGRPHQKNKLVVYAWTSIFSSQPESSLQRILHPPYPFPMALWPYKSGWIKYTGQLIMPCVGCQPNWQSGLLRTCRVPWDFLKKMIRGQSLELIGPLKS